jgi:exopolyphosphatase/pppGpp-phosphohydrolase
MLGVLIWIAKGTESRLKDVEKEVVVFKAIHAERKSTLTQHNGRLLFLENETKQQATTLQTLKELLLTQYHDKEETERHRARLEGQLHGITQRLDTMSRPHHRHSDDRE